MKVKNITNKPINLKLDGKWKVLEPFDVVEPKNLKGNYEFNKILDIPARMVDRQEGIEPVEPVEPIDELSLAPIPEPEPEPEPVESEHLDKEALSKMSKDELNDHGARIGLSEISSKMKKDDMIQAILEFQNENEKEEEEREE